jgi:hypothetical protein
VNGQARAHLAAGQPVVSVDTKKKELVGRYANGGREWRPAGEPERVGVHDFPDQELGKAIPYGVYDLGANAGWVSVGTDHDTAAFAVATLRRWWQQAGQMLYPTATQLLVCADAGGPRRLPLPVSGTANWPPWQPRQGFRSRSARSRRAPPGGTSRHDPAVTREG